MAREKLPSQAEHHIPASTHPSHQPFSKPGKWGGVTEYGSRTSKEILAKLREFKNKEPNKSWATLVLDRHRAGEHIPFLVVEMAREVAIETSAETQMREPGSDDE